MKTILIFGLLIAGTPVFADWFPVGKQGASLKYSSKSICEQSEGQGCFDIGRPGVDYKDPRFHEVQTQQVDDLTKPIYKPIYNVENCDSPEDCQTKQGAKNDCTSGDYTQYSKNDPPIPGYSLYCTGISGYEQKTVETLVVNQALKDSIEAADAAKAQTESQIATMQKHVAFGNRLIAYIGARNVSKNLTTAQVKQVVETYSTIQQLLSSGSLVTAKEEIEAITPDGTLITQADKDALLAEINAYLGQ